MPYSNEHAARIRDPGDFIPDSFRSKDLKGGVRIIIGKLRMGGDGMTTQAYRFSVDDFTPEEARKWLKDNKVSFIKFEPAKNESTTRWSMNDKNSLKHVGVLGMKWGHRKAGGESSGGGRRSAKKLSSDYKTAHKLKKKHASELSNEELKQVSKRLELEKKYKELNPNKVNKGKKAVNSIFATMNTTAGAAVTVTALLAVGRKIYKYAQDKGSILNVNPHLGGL